MKTLGIVTGLEEVEEEEVVDETEMMIGWEKLELESMPMPWNLLLYGSVGLVGAEIYVGLFFWVFVFTG